MGLLKAFAKIYAYLRVFEPLQSVFKNKSKNRKQLFHYFFKNLSNEFFIFNFFLFSGPYKSMANVIYILNLSWFWPRISACKCVLFSSMARGLCINISLPSSLVCDLNIGQWPNDQMALDSRLKGAFARFE